MSNLPSKASKSNTKDDINPINNVNSQSFDTEKEAKIQHQENLPMAIQGMKPWSFINFKICNTANLDK